MTKVLSLSLLAANLMVVVVVSSADAERGSTSSSDFSEALKSARSYPVQMNSEQSRQIALNRFSKVLNVYPNHPDRYKAELEMLTILRLSGTRDSIRQARSLSQQMLETYSLASEAGQSAALQLGKVEIRTQLFYPKIANVGPAITTLKNVAQQSDQAGDYAAYMAARSIQSKLHLVSGEPQVAFDLSYSTVSQALGRSKTGYWEKLYEDSPSEYKRTASNLTQNVNALAEALRVSSNSRDALRVAKHPVMTVHFPILTEVLKNFRNENILGDQDVKEKMEQYYDQQVSSIKPFARGIPVDLTGKNDDKAAPSAAKVDRANSPSPSQKAASLHSANSSQPSSSRYFMPWLLASMPILLSIVITLWLLKKRVR